MEKVRGHNKGGARGGASGRGGLILQHMKYEPQLLDGSGVAMDLALP